MCKILVIIIKETVVNSWWVILFGLFCFALYEQGLKKSHESLISLSYQLTNLQIEKAKALKLQEQLAREVNSQNDPDWIELILMKELGLTPEGYTKVLFN